MWWQAQKREAAGIGDGASKLKLTQQKQQNAGCQKSSEMPQCCHSQNIKFSHNATVYLTLHSHNIWQGDGKMRMDSKKRPEQFHFSGFGSLSISTVWDCCWGWGYLCCSLEHVTQSTAKGHRNHWWLTIISFDLFRFPAPPYQTVVSSVIHQKDTIGTIRLCQGHF